MTRYLAEQRGRRPSRRRFLAAGGLAAAGGAASLVGFPGRARAETGRARTISIFHTTDLHGRILPTQTYEGLQDVGGFARVATCLRQWRKACPHSLTVDVGDVVQGTAVSMHSGGRLMIDLFNRLGYDAWTLGNHDFDWGPEKTEGLLADSGCPVLTANIERGGARPGGFDGVWERVRPWTIREVGGFRIGLIGLITPGLPYWLPPEVLGGVSPLDPAATLAAAVREVRAEKVDAVVVTGHMGWRFDDDYANPLRTILRDAKGVDVYLAGHWWALYFERMIALRREYRHFFIVPERVMRLMRSDSCRSVTDSCLLRHRSFAFDAGGRSKGKCVMGEQADCDRCGCIVPFSLRAWKKPSNLLREVWRDLKNRNQ